MSRVTDEPEAIAGILAILILGGVVWWAESAASNERDEWRQFAAEHHCRVVSKIDGQVFSTFSVGADGKPAVGIGSTGAQYGWVCDDGTTYFRSESN